jgi:TolB-like protein/class 3 adenylate cyclase/Tfp pilus assembly protein PilF
VMHNEQSTDVKFEIGHVLFIDIVGYSKLLITGQSEQLQKLKEIVRGTEQFRLAEAEGNLLRLPTGDGGALVFRNSPEAPVLCAMEIAQALKNHPELHVRMGIHSGPVNEVADLNEQANIAGAGINLAQRVMDCGDAGHILLSKHVAEDLEHYPRWQPYLHSLGECEVKHGVRLGVVNLQHNEVGNPITPTKLQAVQRRHTRMRWTAIVTGLLLLGAIMAAFVLLSKKSVRSALGAAEKSIAVLPFENLSRDPDNAYFTDGVQDEILSDLAKIADLKVISRTSVMLYKAGNPRNLREIGQQLGVAHVLEGSVQRAAGKVRVNAQLIDARTDKHLWAKTYDRELADVFAIESEVAQLIANELQAKLSASEKASIEEKPTQDLAAYDFYVRAIPLIDWAGFGSTPGKDLSQAVDLLNQAIARDPRFVLAYCRLALAHDTLYFLGVDHTLARLALAKSAIDSAFRLEPDSGEAHLALAWHLYDGYFDYDHARAELAIAQRTLPNDPEVFQLAGMIDRRQGRWADAVRNQNRASELDPRSVLRLVGLATDYRLLREYEQEDKSLARILSLDPNEFLARLDRASIEFDRRADTRPWHAELEKILTEDPARAENEDVKQAHFFLALFKRDVAAADRAVAALPQNFEFNGEIEVSRDFWVGVVARIKGNAETARTAFTVAHAQQEEAVRARPDYGPLLCGLGMIDAGLGRKEEALREGRRAIELTPVAKNSLNGAAVLSGFALICAWTGERDLAIAQLEALAKIPAGQSYGDLRLSPLWDSLRGDPRFEKVMAETAKPVKLD